MIILKTFSIEVCISVAFYLVGSAYAVDGSSLSSTPVAPTYHIIDLGTLGGSNSYAHSINNLGQVVGTSEIIESSTLHATLFSGTGNENTDLGIFGSTFSSANDINNSGKIIGSATFTGSVTQHATVYSGTGSGNLDLGTFGGRISEASAINNFGQIVGYAYATGNNSFHAFSENGIGYVDLGTLGGTNSSASAINDLGQIVGSSSTSGNTAFRATLFAQNGGANIDLGTLGGSLSAATAINNSGMIVGFADTADNIERHATLFSGNGNGNIDLGTLGGSLSTAYSINNFGQIVGNSVTAESAWDRAFLYSGDTMSDLNVLAANDAQALGITRIQLDGYGKAINDWGQIAATGIVGDIRLFSSSRALLLNPENPLTTIEGTQRNTKFVGGMDYSKFTTTSSGTTSVSLLGGIVGSRGIGIYGLNRDVNASVTTTAALFGNQVQITGTEGDTFVLSITFDPSSVGTGNNLALGWLNESGEWVNAVDGNTGGTATFVNGAWNSSYTLGTYGIDEATNSVWAVINHNSTFAVIAVPESSTALLSGLLILPLMLRRRKL